MTPQQIFTNYFGRTPTEKAAQRITNDLDAFKSDCETWLSDLEITDGRLNERIKSELEYKITSLYRKSEELIYEQVEKIFCFSTFEDFINEYFPFRSIEYKIGKHLCFLEETDKETLDKLGQYAKDNKELFLQLIEATK
jgi:hypothetical protein